MWPKTKKGWTDLDNAIKEALCKIPWEGLNAAQMEASLMAEITAVLLAVLRTKAAVAGGSEDGFKKRMEKAGRGIDELKERKKVARREERQALKRGDNRGALKKVHLQLVRIRSAMVRHEQAAASRKQDRSDQQD